MKKIYNKFLVAAVLLSSLQGCKKLTDLKPTDLITEDVIFQTVEDVEKGLYGVYGSLDGVNTMILNAAISDEVKLSNENRGQAQPVFKWQYFASDSEGDEALAGWFGYYAVIGIANKILLKIDAIPATTTAEQERKARIKGELLAIRAFAHFELLQRYSARYSDAGLGIPYTTGSDVSAKPARLTMKQVVDLINQDFTDALSAPIPVAPVSAPNVGIIRLSKAAIEGFRARVALYKRDYDNAITYANNCLSQSGIGLSDRITFSSIWSDDSENEILFKLRRNGISVGQLWQDLNGDVFYEPSDKLKSKFDKANDIRWDAYFLNDPGAEDTSLVFKFYASSRGSKIVDIKMLRVSEMYLILAEAYAEKDDLVNAAKWYNDLRRARIEPYTDDVFISKADGVEKVMDERFRELCFEGFRYFDLKRRGLPIERLASDVQSANWQTLPVSNFRMVLPIPRASLQSNPNMIQNPNY